MDGMDVTLIDGNSVGTKLGTENTLALGADDGLADCVRVRVGLLVGLADGLLDGTDVGRDVGIDDG